MEQEEIARALMSNLQTLGSASEVVLYVLATTAVVAAGVFAVIWAKSGSGRRV